MENIHIKIICVRVGWIPYVRTICWQWKPEKPFNLMTKIVICGFLRIYIYMCLLRTSYAGCYVAVTTIAIVKRNVVNPIIRHATHTYCKRTYVCLSVLCICNRWVCHGGNSVQFTFSIVLCEQKVHTFVGILFNCRMRFPVLII